MTDDTEKMDVRFHTTKWSLVASSRKATALASLVQIYWKPLYFYLRQHGHDREVAKDLLQDFLTHAVQRRLFTRADPSRGRFRTFLLAALANFVKDRLRTASRQKRGGGRLVVPLDFIQGEHDFRQLVFTTDTPETAFERAWARSLLEQCLSELEAKPAHVSAFKLYLQGAGAREIALKTGMTESAVKSAALRLRPKFRRVLIRHIGLTAESKEELEEEIAHFLSLLS